MDKYVGKRLDGRYEIEEIIGIGGMAVVYKAYDNVEDRTVAIKILKDEFVSNEDFIRRFKNESKAIAILSHPNIVKVYDVSFGDLIQYIVMEYIDGITLKEHIEHQGSLLWKDAVYYIIQILRALGHAHDKGIVHRDVKPQNIMVLNDGTIKVTDFGIARFARSEQRTMTEKAIGSVHYISPEQARGDKTDEKADIYSVGVILYEMLTGQLPFEADSAVSVAIMQLQKDPVLPTQINSSIPLGLEQITMKAMQKSPERRYQAASEMLCDLEAFKKDPAMTFDHMYFVDTEPTRNIQLGAQEPVENEEIEVETPEKKSSTIPILLGITTAFVIAIAVLGAIFIPKLFKSSGSEFACPNFVGMNKEEILSGKNKDNFVFVWEQNPNDKYEVGVVYEQSIKEGKKIKKGQKITLKVSQGPAEVEIPDVSNKSKEVALDELRSKGLDPVTQEIESDEIKEGNVVKTSPESGKKVSEKTKVTVYVSKGKKDEPKKVPDVISCDRGTATSIVEGEGFKIKFTEEEPTYDNYQKEGLVFSQDPAPDSMLSKGSTITAKISTGVCRYSIELDLEDFDKSYINNSTGKFVLKVSGEGITKEYNIDDTSTLPKAITFDSFELKNKKSVKISIYYDEKGTKYDLYNGSVKMGGSKVYCE